MSDALGENIFFETSASQKMVLYPQIGKKQHDEFIKLLAKQFRTEWLLEVECDNEDFVSYSVVKGCER